MPVGVQVIVNHLQHLESFLQSFSFVLFPSISMSAARHSLPTGPASFPAAASGNTIFCILDSSVRGYTTEHAPPLV